MDLAIRVMLRALLRGHVEIVGQRSAPQRRADMHVEGQRGRTAGPSHLGGDQRVRREVRAQSAM